MVLAPLLARPPARALATFRSGSAGSTARMLGWELARAKSVCFEALQGVEALQPRGLALAMSMPHAVNRRESECAQEYIHTPQTLRNTLRVRMLLATLDLVESVTQTVKS